MTFEKEILNDPKLTQVQVIVKSDIVDPDPEPSYFISNIIMVIDQMILPPSFDLGDMTVTLKSGEDTWTIPSLANFQGATSSTEITTANNIEKTARYTFTFQAAHSPKLPPSFFQNTIVQLEVSLNGGTFATIGGNEPSTKSPGRVYGYVYTVKD